MRVSKKVLVALVAGLAAGAVMAGAGRGRA